MSLEKIANTHLEALEIMVSDYINLKSNLLKKKTSNKGKGMY